jgi:5-methylcytosine-specific restriction endonuclease McrA
MTAARCMHSVAVYAVITDATMSARNPYADRVYQQARPVVLARSGGRCEWPGCTKAATSVDHVLPLSKGGTHDLANLRASCRACNSRGGMAVVNALRWNRRLGKRSRQW